MPREETEMKDLLLIWMCLLPGGLSLSFIAPEVTVLESVFIMLLLFWGGQFYGSVSYKG